jgi:phosphoglucosamine mutase
MGKYFGTDGFRGEANVDLTVEHAFKVGRFLGCYYGKDHKAKIVIGKDTRRSSYMFEYSLVAGLTASGADAYLLHVTTTPSVSYVVRSEDFDCGIMITASHNPFYDNGIKVINGQGFKLEADIEAMIEDYIDSEEDNLPLAKREDIGKTVDYAMGRNRYIGHLISLATRSFDGIKVGLDLANGSATTVAKGVFDALGAKTYVMANEPNGLNINTDCGSTHIEKLQKFVVENGLAVGFAYDGDADRCLCVDEKGNLVDGDRIMYMCGVYMAKRGELNNNTVVTTVMSNMGLYKALEAKGIRYEQTAVGDKYVSENMLANDHSLGGENSGHIIFSKYAKTGDGVLTSVKIMEVMLESKLPISELSKDMKTYPQLLKNVRVKNKKLAREDEEVIKAVEEATKELNGNGRILLRESGTEPVIRVMAEADSMEKCEKVVGRIVDVIAKQGHVC